MTAKTWIMATAGAALVVTALGASTLTATAHERGGKRSGEGFGPRFEFSELDTNSDGKLTRDELTARARSHFDSADSDGDGKLNAEEMIAHAEARRAERDARRADKRAERMQRGAERMLKRMDADNDGAVSFEEMGQSRKGRGLDAMFTHLDTNADGALSEEEVAAMKLHGGKKRGHGGEGRGGAHRDD